MNNQTSDAVIDLGGPGGGSGRSNALALSMMEARPDQGYQQARADAVRQVESTIVELGQIFNQLATMVAEQVRHNNSMCTLCQTPHLLPSAVSFLHSALIHPFPSVLVLLKRRTFPWLLGDRVRWWKESMPTSKIRP